MAGRYQIERELGRGGMATVYLARDLRHQRSVALKVLRPEVSGALGAERFAREIAIAARLSHPHILPIHDSGTLERASGPPGLFYTMPYVAGRSVRDRLDEEPQLPIEEAVRIARQVAEALDHAHRLGIIHRDIKPENILLAEGEAIVADFGLARALDAAGGERLTETGLVLGTPAYMSPEQGAGSSRLDGRSDVYALGCVLYEMLAGQPPFTGPTAQAVLARHASDPVPSVQTVRPTISAELSRVITRALAKVPADRYRTGAQFLQALDHAVAGSGSPSARSVLGWASVAAVVVVLAAVVFVGLARRSRTVPSSSPELVGVLPFRTSGATAELAWLREGLVDLFAIELTGEGGLRAVNPRRVLSRSGQAIGASGREPEPEAALELARRLGAARVIDGAIIGTPNHLLVSASMIAAPSGRRLAQASVEGPVDSITAMVTRLVAELLASEAGQGERLGNLGNLSLPALRAFLQGQAALREARWKDALAQFNRALDLDSTFPQAAMGLMEAAGWTGGDEEGRGPRIAWTYRDRLGSGDLALLLALLGPTYPRPPTGVEWTAAHERAVAAAPDRSEAWYHLAENYYHWGAAIGLDDGRRLAARAFRRALALDSSLMRSVPNDELMVHLRQIAAIEGDTEAVKRLAGPRFAAESASHSLDWRTAQFFQDSASLARVRAGLDNMGGGELEGIVTRSIEDGIPPGDAELAVGAMTRRATTDGERARAEMYRYLLAMNGGRPTDARRAMKAFGDATRLRRSITDALYWGGDSSLGRAAVRVRQPGADAPLAEDTEERLDQQADICLVEQWRLAHGERRTARGAIEKLRQPLPGLDPNDSVRAASYASICAGLLEAWVATLDREPAASALALGVDSLVRQVPPGWVDEDNLVAARLLEAHGHLPQALAAVRRRRFDLVPWFTSSYLREEGRLAALLGDTAGAIEAYRHYLVLRPKPEPGVKPEVERVREELARLVQEPRP